MNLAMDLIREALLGGSGGGGGGGGGIAELIKTQSLGTLSTTSTTEVNTGLTISVPNANVYDILIVLTKAKESAVDYHIGTATFLCLNKQTFNGILNITNVTTIKNKYVMSYRHNTNGDYIRSSSGSTEYGVYVKNTSYTDNIDVSTVYMKYNSTESGTINGDFDAYVYGIKFPVEI